MSGPLSGLHSPSEAVVVGGLGQRNGTPLCKDSGRFCALKADLDPTPEHLMTLLQTLIWFFEAGISEVGGM